MASSVTVVHADVSGSGTLFSGSGWGCGDVVINVGWPSGLLDEDIVQMDASAASLETSVGGTLCFVFRANINGLSGAPASLYEYGDGQLSFHCGTFHCAFFCSSC